MSEANPSPDPKGDSTDNGTAPEDDHDTCHHGNEWCPVENDDVPPGALECFDCFAERQQAPAGYAVDPERHAL